MSKIILELLCMSYPVILAAVLHMVVVKMKWFNVLCYPLDHYKTFRQKRIFGQHKTYRGLVVMLVLSVVFTYLHQYLSANSAANLLNYDNYSANFYGVLFGLGYIVGELPNSFFKRQIDVQPGQADGLLLHWIDQVDSVSFILLLLIPFSGYSWIHLWVGTLFFGTLHLAINYLLYLTGIRKSAL